MLLRFIQPPLLWFLLDAWIRGVTSAKPQRSSSPFTSFEAPRGQIPVLVLGPLGLCNCFDIFHPFYHHIFFSSPFCRMLLRSKNSKSTAPLTLISMPRCVLRCQDFSASFLRAALSLQSSLASLCPLRLLLITLTAVRFSHLPLACLGTGNAVSVGLGLLFPQSLS